MKVGGIDTEIRQALGEELQSIHLSSIRSDELQWGEIQRLPENLTTRGFSNTPRSEICH